MKPYREPAEPGGVERAPIAAELRLQRVRASARRAAWIAVGRYAFWVALALPFGMLIRWATAVTVAYVGRPPGPPAPCADHRPEDNRCNPGERWEVVNEENICRCLATSPSPSASASTSTTPKTNP